MWLNSWAAAPALYLGPLWVYYRVGSDPTGTSEGAPAIWGASWLEILAFQAQWGRPSWLVAIASIWLCCLGVVRSLRQPLSHTESWYLDILNHLKKI